MQSKIYGTATLNDKGQLVVPAEARSEIGLKPGSRLTIIRAPIGNALLLVKTEFIEAHLQSLASALLTPEKEEQE